MANEKRLIEANVFVRDLTAMKSVYDAIALDGMIKALKDAPTVDAVEVVRCMECRNFRADEIIAQGTGTCSFCEMVRRFGDFCSYGKRKDGDGDG